jgi:hypothetical protein
MSFIAMMSWDQQLWSWHSGHFNYLWSFGICPSESLFSLGGWVGNRKLVTDCFNSCPTPCDHCSKGPTQLFHKMKLYVHPILLRSQSGVWEKLWSDQTRPINILSSSFYLHLSARPTLSWLCIYIGNLFWASGTVDHPQAMIRNFKAGKFQIWNFCGELVDHPQVPSVSVSMSVGSVCGVCVCGRWPMDIGIDNWHQQCCSGLGTNSSTGT